MQNDGLPLYSSDYNTQVQIKKFNQKSEPMSVAVQPAVEPMPPMPHVPAKPLLGPVNTVTTCQFCHASIKTAVKYTTTARTHMAAALCGIMCCLCCVPYSSDSAKNTDHYCPNCERYLGTYVK
ncbi:lipopolysaccharide-induced tumor necrosis factor-alpha factor homolog isoform X1 [Spodoptera frugiperda]|uniref:Lipopolysaccharide-induced tumor necrosis factor-alpha factor homolog isoform X1 n=1 Tax=Spodoptera frugiperda TaxID=7108 RepID=A0A9R0EFL9_SPOFR|nr:lipopolysaccharide-induced tumor necrosis factor-alpha factor homolog isoform X1 [Spodoptera frugiperda]XP_050553128.1 lipopolysaccharide-induced tumor necrosis factor-alpha factor homolog isoform X1 [Spodoptera frugiperda]